jgi:hypothetical protein
MVSDVSTGDYTRMFCLNCARRIVSPRSTGKYDPLTSYLKFRAAFTDTIKLSFAKIDGIIGENLPMSVYREEKWWNNSPKDVHAKVWLDAGWKVQEVNLEEGCVVFKKTEGAHTRSFRRKASRTKALKPFTPVRVRIPKSRKPSKTKVSKLYARLKNLERNRATTPRIHGSFKPRPSHEKRLFKPEKKPQ